MRFFATFLALLLSSPINATPADFDASLAQLDSSIRSRWSTPDITDLSHARKTAEEYFQLFGSSKEPKHLSRHELSTWFKAAYTTHYYSVDPEVLGDLVRLADELEERGHLTDEQAQWMHSAYVAARRFEKANAWKAEHAAVDAPDVPSLPEGVGHLDTAPVALFVKGEPPGFEKRLVEIGTGKQVVITASPACHFTREAFKAIKSDSELQAAIGDAVLLDRPSGLSHFELFAGWAEKYPDYPILPVVRLEGWDIPHWNTPHFYFMNEGRIIAEVTGWPKGGNREALLEAATMLQDSE